MSTARELLSFCFCLLTLSGITLGLPDGSGVVRVVVEEGSDAILPCSLSNKENAEYKLFDWKKDGQKEVFFYEAGVHYNNGLPGQDQQFKGRVSHFQDELKYGNASIIIRNTKVTDSGDYSCDFQRLQPRQIFNIQLVVGSDGIRLVVEEGSDAILPCSLSTKENIEEKLFDWKKDGQKEVFFYDGGVHYNNGRPGQDQQFKGRVSHFQDELQYGNASIIIRDTKVTDSGDYSCDFPQLQPRQILNIQLLVELTFRDRSGEISGAAAEPSVRTLNQTKDWALLQCDVRGASPKPTVEWQDSAGNKLPAEEPQVSERGGSFYISLQTTVKKTDRYRCVATQEEIKHQIYAETYVEVNGSYTGLIVAVAVLVVVGGVLAVLCHYRKRIMSAVGGCFGRILNQIAGPKIQQGTRGSTDVSSQEGHDSHCPEEQNELKHGLHDDDDDVIRRCLTE